MVMLVLSVYASLKYTELVSRSNPNITRYLERDEIKPTEKINMHNAGKHFAFGVEGFFDKELKDDPRYVKMLVRLFQ